MGKLTISMAIFNSYVKLPQELKIHPDLWPSIFGCKKSAQGLGPYYRSGGLAYPQQFAA